MTAITIVSLVSLLGWLVLAMRNPEMQRLGLSRGAMLAFIWVATFVVVALVIGQIVG